MHLLWAYFIVCEWACLCMWEGVFVGCEWTCLLDVCRRVYWIWEGVFIVCEWACLLDLGGRVYASE